MYRAGKISTGSIHWKGWVVNGNAVEVDAHKPSSSKFISTLEDSALRELETEEGWRARGSGLLHGALARKQDGPQPGQPAVAFYRSDPLIRWEEADPNTIKYGRR